MQCTPDSITSLQKNEIFVFGSNESGLHLGGAARFALEHFGAINGQGFGPQGKSFAIPTLDWNLKQLHPIEISNYIDRFLDYTQVQGLGYDKLFYVTKIGIGIAGFSLFEIAPAFADVMNNQEMYKNVILPKEFWDEYY